MNFFHDFFTRFTAVVRSIVSFIIPIAESKAGDIIAAGLPLALTIVKSYATSPLTPDAKRSAAVTDLGKQLASQGLAAASSIGVSTLNFIVETALQNLKTTSA